MKILIIVPPFASVTHPYLAAHILKALAEEDRFSLDIKYANISYAACIGGEKYNTITYQEAGPVFGEGIFAELAYKNVHGEVIEKYYRQRGRKPIAPGVKELTAITRDWGEEFLNGLDLSQYSVIGSSTTFCQTSSSVYLLNRIKEKFPEKITIIGGANCDDEMAEAIVQLSDKIDYVFSGECEEAFPSFLKTLKEGNLPRGNIIRGNPCKDLNGIPAVNYDEYYSQLYDYFPDFDTSEIWITYETSRGC